MKWLDGCKCKIYKSYHTINFAFIIKNLQRDYDDYNFLFQLPPHNSKNKTLETLCISISVSVLKLKKA